MLQKGPNYTIKMNTTVTENYMVQDCFILGTSMRAKCVFHKL